MHRGFDYQVYRGQEIGEEAEHWLRVEVLSVDT